MTDVYKDVAKFHKTYELRMPEKIDFPDKNEIKERVLRVNLVSEEYGEYIEAEREGDLTKIVDALGDLVYVVVGTAIAYGVNFNTIFDEIQNSNMSKLDNDGKVIKRADGKVLKGPNFFSPDIAGKLKEMGDWKMSPIDLPEKIETIYNLLRKDK